MKRLAITAAAAIIMSFLSLSVFAQVPKHDTTKRRPDTIKRQQDTARKTTTTTTTTTTTAATDTAKKDIAATLANVAEETTFTAAIKTANLEATLKGPGPYTVFAPNNADFDAIQKGKLDTLMKDPNKLGVLVKAHVVNGFYDKAALIKALTAGKGTTTLKTIDGQTLTISVKNKKLAVTDSQGTTVEVTSFDTPATNGVIHGVNGVLMSK